MVVAALRSLSFASSISTASSGWLIQIVLSGASSAHPVNARCILEKVDMLSFHGVTPRAPRRKMHVHQLTVSALRYRRLPLCEAGICGRHDDVSYRAAA